MSVKNQERITCDHSHDTLTAEDYPVIQWEAEVREGLCGRFDSAQVSSSVARTGELHER